jgi:hypothetical protein
MVGSAALARGARLGVYWETYGFAPSDTVAFTVWVERFTEQGILRELGVRLNIATDRNTPVAVSWTENEAGRNAAVIGGAVSVIGRSIVLNTAALPPGEYWLDIVASGAGKEPVRSRRKFVVAAQ